MPDYQQGKIYKIVCNVTGDVYYGSTTKIRLCDRIGGHRSDYKSYLNKTKLNYTTSFKILENENYYYALVELYPCNSKDELLGRERIYIENNPCVNKSIPTRTRLEYQKTYREINKEEVASWQKEYRTRNSVELAEKKCQYYLDNRERLIQYQKENKDRKNELRKIKYDANKEEINRIRREKNQLKREASK